MKTLLVSYHSLLIIVTTGLTSMIAFNSVAIQYAQGIEQNNTTNITSGTPIDAVTVIKQGEQSVSSQLDQAREAVQSENTSQAIQYIEQAQDQLDTLAICATSVINATNN